MVDTLDGQISLITICENALNLSDSKKRPAAKVFRKSEFMKSGVDCCVECWWFEVCVRFKFKHKNSCYLQYLVNTQKITANKKSLKLSTAAGFNVFLSTISNVKILKISQYPSRIRPFRGLLKTKILTIKMFLKIKKEVFRGGMVKKTIFIS